MCRKLGNDATLNSAGLRLVLETAPVAEFCLKKKARLSCGFAAEKNGIAVSMCGAMAGDPLYTLILLGLGISELSMNPSAIPRVKRILRQVDKAVSEEILQELLDLPTAREIIQRLENRMAVLFPDLFSEPAL